MPRVASYAAAIEKAVGHPVETESGKRGQFDVIVNGETVVSRNGGLLAFIMRKPWPGEQTVIEKIRTAAG